MGIDIMNKKEIQDEIQRLSSMLKDIEKEERHHLKEEAKQNIGRCFIVNGEYIKIIDTPHEVTYRDGTSYFNEYQYTGLYLCKECGFSTIPLYFNDVFSGVWGFGKNVINKEIKEISHEEFREEFDRVIENFKNIHNI